MARPELGTKRVCPTTGRKFYDLNKSPIVSPYTGQVVPIAAVSSSRARVEAAPARPAPSEEEVELEPAGEAELISLEEADEETTSSGTATVADEDVSVDGADEADDAPFLEDEEDEGDDVTDLIGDGMEDEEEP